MEVNSTSKNEDNENGAQTVGHQPGNIHLSISALQIKRALLRNLKGIYGFDLQIDMICDRMSVPRSDLQSQIELIKKDLAFSFPSPFQLISCGSMVHDLYQVGASIDIHLGQSHVTVMGELKRLYLVTDTLRENEAFSNPRLLTNQNRKVVMCEHQSTRLNVVIDVMERLQKENTDLVKYYVDLHDTIKKVLFVLKFWAKCRDIINEQLTSYAFSWMVIFYLQCEYNVPSVATLQTQWQDAIVDDWVTKFEAKSFNSEKLVQKPLSSVIANFFTFYSQFDFFTFVVCPFLGRAVRKSDFLSANNVKQAGLSRYALVFDKTPFVMELSLCVQDPIEQCRNLTFGATLAHISKFQMFCTWCAGYLNGPVLLFPQTLTRMESAEEMFAFTVPRNESLVDMDVWFTKFEDLLVTVLKDVILANMNLQDGWGIYKELNWVEYECEVQDDVWTGRYAASKEVAFANPNKTELEQAYLVSAKCKTPKPMYKLSVTLKMVKMESAMKVHFLGNLKHHYLHPIKAFLLTHLTRWMQEWEKRFVQCKMQPHVVIERMDFQEVIKEKLRMEIEELESKTPEIELRDIISAIRATKKEMINERSNDLEEQSKEQSGDKCLEETTGSKEELNTSSLPGNVATSDVDIMEISTGEEISEKDDSQDNVSIESGEVASDDDDDDIPDDFFDDFNKEEFLEDLIQSTEPEEKTARERSASPDSVVFISEKPSRKKHKSKRKRNFEELRRYQEDFLQEVREKIEKATPSRVTSYTDPSVAYPSTSTSKVAMVAPYCPPQPAANAPINATAVVAKKTPTGADQYTTVRKRIEILARCYDALKIFNNLHDKFVVVPTVQRDKEPLKGQSPMTRVPAVRFHYTSLLKNPNRDGFEMALNKMLKALHLEELSSYSCAQCLKKMGAVESLSVGTQVTEEDLAPRRKRRTRSRSRRRRSSRSRRSRPRSRRSRPRSRSRQKSVDKSTKIPSKCVRKTRSRSSSRTRRRPGMRSRSTSKPKTIRPRVRSRSKEPKRSRSRSRGPVRTTVKSRSRSRARPARRPRSRESKSWKSRSRSRVTRNRSRSRSRRRSRSIVLKTRSKSKENEKSALSTSKARSKSSSVEIISSRSREGTYCPFQRKKSLSRSPPRSRL